MYYFIGRGIVRKSCIVVCNSPPFGLPSCECADDYYGKTVEQLAEEMGQKVITKHFNFISVYLCYM